MACTSNKSRGDPAFQLLLLCPKSPGCGQGGQNPAREAHGVQQGLCLLWKLQSHAVAPPQLLKDTLTRHCGSQ